MLAASIPLALYVHWPWCVRKCPYCDFNSHALPAGGDEASRYIDALIADLLANKTLAGNRALVSVFIGGGTPSLIAPAHLERFLNALQKHFTLAPELEITLEANPGTVDTAHFQAYRLMGVNRLSMGIQSFDETLLKTLERIHNRREALEAISIAQSYFDNFNLDVMYALPGQSLQALESDLKHAVAAQSTHLSFYQLTIEPHTVFAKHRPENLPDEDLIARMQDLVVETLSDAGFDHYEVSGYAKPGHYCRHNLNYWQYGDYLACGAGAHSKITLSDGRILRQVRFVTPQSFMKHALEGNAVSRHRIVPKEDEAFEFMLNVLRLRKGVPLQLLEERTHLSFKDIETPIRQAQKLGLMDEPLTALVANAKGWDFLSDLQELFL